MVRSPPNNLLYRKVLLLGVFEISSEGNLWEEDFLNVFLRTKPSFIIVFCVEELVEVANGWKTSKSSIFSPRAQLEDLLRFFINNKSAEDLLEIASRGLRNLA